MANWIPNDPSLVAQIFKIRAAYAPPPEEDFPNPLEWGIEANVIERFAAAGIPRNEVSFRHEMYDFTFPGAPADLMNEFRYYHGETMEAFEAAEKKWPRRRHAERVMRAFRGSEHRQARRLHFDPRSVLASDGYGDLVADPPRRYFSRGLTTESRSYLLAFTEGL